METRHPETTAPPVLEHRLNHRQRQRRRTNRLEILLRGQIDQRSRPDRTGRVGERPRDALTPEGIEIPATRIGQPGSHLQTVGLHQVERTQHAVEPGKDAQVPLGEGKIVRRQRPRRKPVIDIAVEGKHRRTSVLGRKWPRPLGIAHGVQRRERIADTHQPGQRRRRKGPQLPDKALGIVEEIRLREGNGRDRRGVVERLGGGNDKDHR